MNNNLKTALIAVGSFTAGYFLANYRNEDFYFKRANEQIEETREAYEEKLSEVEKELSDTQRTLKNLQTEDPDLDAAAQALAGYQGKGGFEPVDVHALAPQPEPQHAKPQTIQYSDYISSEAVDKTDVPEVPKNDLVKNVEIITEEQFVEGKDEYDQGDLQYHVGNDVLSGARADDGPIDPDLRAQIMGEYNDILKRENAWDENDSIYIRNHELKYDFTITREDGIFADGPESSGGDG